LVNSCLKVLDAEDSFYVLPSTSIRGVRVKVVSPPTPLEQGE